MEEAQPAPPAAQVGAVDDRGEAPETRGHVTRGLPAYDEYATCPKCGNSQRGFQITYHAEAQIAEQTRPLAPQIRETPCIGVPPDFYPEFSMITPGRGGEHLCILCVNCKFSWVARVADPGVIYDRSPDE